MQGFSTSSDNTRLFIETIFMQKMYLCLAGRTNLFIKLMMVLVMMGFGGRGFWASPRLRLGGYCCDIGIIWAWVRVRPRPRI